MTDIFRRAWLKWSAQVLNSKKQSQLMSEWRGSKLCLVSAHEDPVHGLYMDGEDGHWKGGAGRSLVEGISTGTGRCLVWTLSSERDSLGRFFTLIACHTAILVLTVTLGNVTSLMFHNSFFIHILTIIRTNFHLLHLQS